MFGRTLLKGLQGARAQVRMGSTFNNPSRKVVKPLGLSGNTFIAIGATFLIVTLTVVQRSGFLIPHTIGPGLSPVGRLEIDLTPDELKK